ncbi:MAG: hypothetical protein JST54_35330, partial [Deltaproteobacteria bacterium]|nr:hypothetical protein [Deltaproteobacteria bacterium]
GGFQNNGNGNGNGAPSYGTPPQGFQGSSHQQAPTNTQDNPAYRQYPPNNYAPPHNVNSPAPNSGNAVHGAPPVNQTPQKKKPADGKKEHH